MKIPKIGIIGGGRFGLTLAEALSANGADVTLLDRDWNVVQSLAESPVRAVQGDATSPGVLRDAGFDTCDIAVVAIGSSLEASTLATILCKDLKIPRVVSKASSTVHGRVLSRIGADNVVYPDRDRAYRLADSILHRRTIELFEIADGYSVAEVSLPPGLSGKTLIEGNVRQAFGVTVLAIRRETDDKSRPRETIVATGHETLRASDRLVVFGSDAALSALSD
ncbi:MAG: TrkA family potassium uptake protein [Kiritimatiellae bacterium]|nr:TrkA family potassium uptake protein [Kiritimatiellia bacterium]